MQAVLFDIGGPLNMEVAHEAAFDADIKEGLRREGFVANDAGFDVAVRNAVDSFAPNLYAAVVWQLTGGNLAASLGIYRWIESQSATRDLFELRPGIIALLQRLRDQGLPLGLAANQPRRVLDTLARHGIRDFFANEGITGVYGFRKPDVRLFLRACADLGVEPTNCVMVGGRIDNDIVPSKLLGMKTVLFRTGRHRDQQPRSWDEIADAEVTDVEGLEAALAEICG